MKIYLKIKKNVVFNIRNFFKDNFDISIINFDKKIDNIILTTDFNQMKKMEMDQGFSEATNGNFFRSGQKNQWKEKLNSKQINKIENNFKEYMIKFEYNNG